MKQRVLFLCTANSARSQMAEGLARHLAGERLEVASAGAEPSSVHPMALRVMAERGIDITGQRSEPLNDFVDQQFDDVVTVCDRAAARCPVFPGPARRQHWPLSDPAAQEGDAEIRLEAFRSARDELERRIRTWLEIPAAEKGS